ncbi:hypothetical protein [Demequina lignilytica]|uniref:Primosomal protein N' 3' DNA-binding domain-containing protein n=1 Tax=Demequina lignilytica TaxID=3051663 RepID=A0AB35ME47_9MICO|nr:hypothetical protein [Demequina sp. SYSU T0a273]MDN4482026.1 hypothetical protein [Demequina sp. SYSU T0a273]
MCVDSALPHLDRPFDYAVPDKLIEKVAVGSRVRVRFAGRLVSGVVTALSDSSDFEGSLAPIHSSAGTASFTPQAIAFAGAVARRYGGSLWDVLRLMAPPRVAAVESREWGVVSPDDALLAAAADALEPAAAALGLPTAELARGARLVWDAIPAQDRSHGLPIEALLAPATRLAADGQSAIVVLPDARAVAAAVEALRRQGLSRWSTRSGGQFTVLQADDGAQTRYASYLAAMHGEARLVIGTRAAILQPVPALGLVVLWDDGAPIYDEPHAPYPHARTLAAMRADETGAGTLIAGYAPSVDAMALVAHGWADRAVADRAVARELTPLIDPMDGERRTVEGASGWHWMPGSVWRRARAALDRGPVGIVVPRAGYVRATACARCDAWAECPACGGALRKDGATAPLRCGDCGAEHPDWHCPECHARATKQLRQGVERIAEQVHAMAGDTPVAVSAGAVGTLPDGSVTEGFVVATPAALPAVDGGYACIVIVGADTPAGGALGAELQALRWWLGIAALARPRGDGGEVIAVGDLPPAVRSALVGWGAGEAAVDAYAERADLGLPPNRRAIRLWGEPPVITLATSVPVEGERIERHRDVTVLPAPDGVTLLATRRVAGALVDALRARQQELSRSGEGELRMRVDAPLEVR